MTLPEVRLPNAPVDVPPMLRLAHAQLALAAQREAWVGDVAAGALGDAAREALAAARAAHPVSVPERAEDLGDPEQASAVLESAIAAVLTREAAGHAVLLATCGDEAEVRLRLAAFEHGLECGREAGAGQIGRGPGAAFDALAGVLLEDMPCRPHVRLVEQTPHRVRWSHGACPYGDAWKRGGVDARPACHVLSAWVRGLVQGLDPSVEYRRPRALALGDERCEHEIVVLSR